MVSQEAAHYVLSSLCFTQGQVKVMVWKEEWIISIVKLQSCCRRHMGCLVFQRSFHLVLAEAYITKGQFCVRYMVGFFF